jgi:hypothetical protein
MTVARAWGAARPALHGAYSRIANMAATPATIATVQYQAGASGLPVTRMSQVMMNWVEPPKRQIETA